MWTKPNQNVFFFFLFHVSVQFLINKEVSKAFEFALLS